MGCCVKNDWSKIRKLSDPDKYKFFKQGIRGSISYIHKRYSEASENVNIFYLDLSNLYGCPLSQYLPISNFKWVNNIDEIKQKLMK